MNLKSFLYDYLLFALDIHSSNQRFTKQFMVEYKNDTKTRAFLNKDEIEELFKPDFHFKHVETIFERVFG